MNSPVRAIVFDWNGTVLDDVSLSVSLLNQLLVECGHPEVNRDRYLEIFGFPIKEYYKRAGFDFSVENYEELADKYMPRYLSRYATEAFIFPDVPAFLQKCKQLGLKTAILSVTKQNYLDRQIEVMGLSGCFDYVVGQSDHYGDGKEDLAKRLIADMQLCPDEVLFVGDTVHDYEVAHGVGARAVLIARGHQSRRRLQEITEEVVDSFDLIEF